MVDDNQDLRDLDWKTMSAEEFALLLEDALTDRTSADMVAEATMFREEFSPGPRRNGEILMDAPRNDYALNLALYAELKPHFMTMFEGAKEMGYVGKDQVRAVARCLIRTFGDEAAKVRPYFMRFFDEKFLR